MEPSDSPWIPALLFALLGGWFLQKAIRPGAKQSWSWGRGGGPVPLSRWAYASWAVTFFSIALLLSYAPKPPMASVIVFLACFLATMAAGFMDTRRYNVAQRLSDPDRRSKDSHEGESP